jgi:hypothetical protein
MLRGNQRNICGGLFKAVFEININQKKMTDKQFNKAIIKCRAACELHLSLLKITEGEYEKRYGNHPSDIDDWWIDSLHYGNGSFDLEKIIENAKRINDK